MLLFFHLPCPIDLALLLQEGRVESNRVSTFEQGTWHAKRRRVSRSLPGQTDLFQGVTWLSQTTERRGLIPYSPALFHAD